uniref:Shisa family member 4 n=1 Tax=Phasianus colchicus TaxID=9054 RepID=A0A669QMM9_PHACC
ERGDGMRRARGCGDAGMGLAGGEDCLWYVDKNGSWHPGFDCEALSFCCGSCHQRYCCYDPLRLLTERQQRHCLAFSPKTIAGIASAVVLFIAIVTTIVCCFMCSCCYLYQRRQHLPLSPTGPEIPLASYPAPPPAPFPVDPKAGPVPPQPGFTPMAMYPPSGPAAQYPLYPSGPPVYNPTGERRVPPKSTTAFWGGPTPTPPPSLSAAPPPYVPAQPSYPGA